MADALASLDELPTATGRPPAWPRRSAFASALFFYWVLNSIMIFVLWAAVLVLGQGWEQGLFVYQSGNIPAFHLLAENLMGATALVGFVATFSRLPWGPTVAMLGVGMFMYSGINSMGWALTNSPAFAIPMALSVIAGMLVVPYLVEELRSPWGARGPAA